VAFAPASRAQNNNEKENVKEKRKRKKMMAVNFRNWR